MGSWSVYRKSHVARWMDRKMGDDDMDKKTSGLYGIAGMVMDAVLKSDGRHERDDVLKVLGLRAIRTDALWAMSRYAKISDMSDVQLACCYMSMASWWPQSAAQGGAWWEQQYDREEVCEGYYIPRSIYRHLTGKRQVGPTYSYCDYDHPVEALWDLANAITKARAAAAIEKANAENPSPVSLADEVAELQGRIGPNDAA